MHTDSYEIVLSYPPAATVMIALEDLADPNQIQVDKSVIEFTTTNWNVAKIIQVTAIDDDLQETPSHTTAIRHIVSSPGDIEYDSLDDIDEPVTVLDNECGSWGVLSGDINEDCAVDLLDFAEIVSQWLSCTIPNDENCLQI